MFQIKKFPFVILIICGAGLNIYFYTFRFLGDGILFPVAIIEAISLELLLAIVVYNYKRNILFVMLSIVIIFYAVIQTSAGQTFSLLSHIAMSEKINNNDIILKNYEQLLNGLSTESETINRQLQSIGTTEGRADYSATVNSATYRLSTIQKQKQNLLNEIKNITIEDKKEKQNENKKISIYEFYSSAPGWDGQRWLQFAFHSFLSFLIAVMTPIGILSITNSERIKNISKKDIEDFINICWYKVCAGTGNYILPVDAWIELSRREGKIVDAKAYNDLFEIAVKSKIIKSDGLIIIRDKNEAIKKFKY